MAADRFEPRIISLSETASTNADAMRLARAGEALPLWVSAKRQTEGRGRAGRSWVSGDGNLQASLAALCTAPLPAAGQLSLVAGVALVDAIQSLSPASASGGAVRLKWPNDLLIGGAKAGGILVECTTLPNRAGFVAVIGFGVNVASAPANLGRAVTSLAHNGFSCTAELLNGALALKMDDWLRRWQGPHGFTSVREAWLKVGGQLGEAIRVHGAAGPVSGTFQGLSSGGALIAAIDGSLQTITYGDVMIAGPGQDGGSR